MSVSEGQVARPIEPASIELRAVAEFLGVTPDGCDGVRVTGVSSSSQSTVTGDIFVALPGARAHGAHHAEDAIGRGACAVVTDVDGGELIRAQANSMTPVPVLVIDDPRAQLGSLSAFVYGTQDQHPKLFGVTGTNGKTTVVYLLAALLAQLGKSVGLSSTAERRIGNQVLSSALTTPESNEVHAFIARMNELRVDAAAIEVSAHALARHRVDGLVFDVAGFTNFSQDHLDDFRSMESYFEAKQKFFTPAHARAGVAIVDSEWGRALVRGSEIPIVTVGLQDASDADWNVEILDRRPDSTAFRLSGPDGSSLKSSVPMVGDFAALNSSLAIVMLVTAGFDVDEISRALSRDSGIQVKVPGRTEIVSGEHGPIVYVDYGHTAEAFAHTLRAVRAVIPGKVIMVFGADGDRDTTKRAEMGAVSARYADTVIVTDFHPRTEDPQAIRAALLAGAHAEKSGADIREEADPRSAVRLAISLAAEGDAVLYAGPGHEDYRDLGSSREEYNAREDTKLALREAGWLS
jgi:UDP-N-acetylmuramoyl-L-alanyl-D-glutamate--2,6-diaminopimelate ligase